MEVDMIEKEYRDCYVAFLDILGFKNMINNFDCNKLYGIFKSIMDASRTTAKVNDKEVEAFGYIEYLIMSDSVVVYIDAGITDALFALLSTCQTIQMALLRDNILLRGGVARGTLFRENSIIFGKGLTQAYLLESNVALFPRIVFNQELLDDGKVCNVAVLQDVWNLFLISKDDDELFYVNPVALARAVRLFDGQDNANEYFNGVLDFCQKELNTSYELSIRQKYQWLKSKIVCEIKRNQQIHS